MIECLCVHERVVGGGESGERDGGSLCMCDASDGWMHGLILPYPPAATRSAAWAGAGGRPRNRTWRRRWHDPVYICVCGDGLEYRWFVCLSLAQPWTAARRVTPSHTRSTSQITTTKRACQYGGSCNTCSVTAQTGADPRFLITPEATYYVVCVCARFVYYVFFIG